MTIYVTQQKSLQLDTWAYWYSEVYNMISLDRVQCQLPLTTLQGAYNLIIKVDRFNIVSYFETVTAAEVTYWTVVSTFEVPKAEAGQVLVVQDIDDGQPQAYFTNPDYTVFYTRLGEPREQAKLRHIAIGEQVIVDVTQDGMLAGVWMLNLPPEVAEKHAMKQ